MRHECGNYWIIIATQRYPPRGRSQPDFSTEGAMGTGRAAPRLSLLGQIIVRLWPSFDLAQPSAYIGQRNPRGLPSGGATCSTGYGNTLPRERWRALWNGTLFIKPHW